MGVKTFFRRFLRRHRRISHRSGLGLDAVRAAREVNRPTPEELFDAECACEFLIVRILGNDLYPRHYERQTINNLGFLLKNESDFPSTRKLFVVNRIFCRDTEAAVLEKLASAGAACVRIPFDHEAYREARMSDESRISEAELERRDNSASRQELLQANILGHAERIRYTMNVNAARNLALREGKGAARWTLPLDGNSILADEAFARLCEEVRSAPLARHVILPFKRLERNDAFLQTRAVGQSREEPQIVFHCRSQLEFDERFPYRPDVIDTVMAMPHSYDPTREAVRRLHRDI